MIPWKCAGCGIYTPMLVRRCACATSVVYTREPRAQAIKFELPIGLLSIAYVNALTPSPIGGSPAERSDRAQEEPNV